MIENPWFPLIATLSVGVLLVVLSFVIEKVQDKKDPIDTPATIPVKKQQSNVPIRK